MEILVTVTFIALASLFIIALHDMNKVLNEYDAQAKRHEEAGREYIKTQKAVIDYLRSRAR